MRGIAVIFTLLLSLAAIACSSTSEGPAAETTPVDEAPPADEAPVESSAPAVEAACNDYERQTELCEATCEECEGEAPGNSCNVCAAACADRVFCQQCNDCDSCETCPDCVPCPE